MADPAIFSKIVSFKGISIFKNYGLYQMSFKNSSLENFGIWHGIRINNQQQTRSK